MKLLTRRSFLIKVASVAVAARCSLAAHAKPHLMFVGTDTSGKSSSKGIYAYRWEPSSGSLVALGLAAATAGPWYMAIAPNRQFLYAVNEVREYKGLNTGTISAFSLDHTSGMLMLKNVVLSGGAGPCNIAIDHTGKAVFVADGAGGSLASYQVFADGSLSDPVSNFHFSGHSINPKRQAGAYTHCTVVSPDNRCLIVNDLGLDRITTFHFDANSAVLTPNEAPFFAAAPGSGPRNFTFHPNARWAYSVNEMGSTIDVLAWDSSRGILSGLQNISTLPAGFVGNNLAATVRVDASGRFLYVSNRGANTIAAFAIHEENGTLAPVQQLSCGGKTPRYFSIDPSNRWLVVGNQDSGNVVVFARNESTGFLSPAGRQYQIDSPTFVIFA